jgi:Flp pilus assembly protein TadG
VRNLLRCRRGVSAFVTVIALVPLIGVVSLGAEAGSWYVTKQHAQNAADAAAYAGALSVACTLAPSCNDTQDYVYRGKEFAAQNAFCNAGGASYPGGACSSLGTNVSQSVAMDRGTWAGGSWTSSASGNDVKAAVSQTQPAYLAAVLGLTTVTIPAQAVARVQKVAKPCVLSLSDPVKFGGSTNVTSSSCGIQSNNTSSSAVSFTGNGNTVTVKPLSVAGGCTNNATGSPCASVNTHDSPVIDPLSGLNSAMSSLTTANFVNGDCKNKPISSTPTTYSSGKCYNTSLPSGALNGVYFLSGNITISGSANISGTATLIFLPGSTLKINGNPTIDIAAPSSVSSTQVPSALSSVTSLMSGLLIYDPEGASWSTAGCGNSGVKLSGSSTSYFSGITYVPYCDVTFTGNNTASEPSSGCTELIAKGVTFTGSSYFDNSGCPASVQIKSLIVALVQ